MMMANAIGANEILVGVAILSGIYFGDRCSPMSTSALLVSELTGTNIYKNIQLMIKASIVPFIFTCAVYLSLGFLWSGKSASLEIRNVFADNFNLHWLTILPAVIIFSQEQGMLSIPHVKNIILNDDKPLGAFLFAFFYLFV
ncbi:Na+/H+ antiporter NhaC [Clostridium pascui]|uniref:Na+/H+ antiporter NhaC family protein n=1 Tax=Clostridium pascui TaxID=46609 RepID=UPI00195E3687|nr:Na+/H+ antiporter NhaC family protein [Clostridium pascui]MBM7870926.1 Na+/H+ antiporter NhaC [Clostridium pascui]